MPRPNDIALAPPRRHDLRKAARVLQCLERVHKLPIERCLRRVGVHEPVGQPIRQPGHGLARQLRDLDRRAAQQPCGQADVHLSRHDPRVRPIEHDDRPTIDAHDVERVEVAVAHHPFDPLQRRITQSLVQPVRHVRETAGSGARGSGDVVQLLGRIERPTRCSRSLECLLERSWIEAMQVQHCRGQRSGQATQDPGQPPQRAPQSQTRQQGLTSHERHHHERTTQCIVDTAQHHARRGEALRRQGLLHNGLTDPDRALGHDPHHQRPGEGLLGPVELEPVDARPETAREWRGCVRKRH